MMIDEFTLEANYSIKAQSQPRYRIGLPEATILDLGRVHLLSRRFVKLRQLTL